jgi:hypothetical protein
MVCCSICGILLFGVCNLKDVRWSTFSGEPPLYALDNTGMVDYLLDVADQWHSCQNCNGAVSDLVKSFATLLTADYQRLLMSTKPLLLQQLCCIDVGMNVKQKYSSFATGQLYTNTLMDHAMIANMEVKPNAPLIGRLCTKQPLQPCPLPYI